MIISHKHEFIFMHGEKTAGSSITIACNPHLGPRDVQVGVWPYIIRNGGKVNRKAILILLGRAPRLLKATLKQSVIQKRFVSYFSVKRVNKEIRNFYKKRAGFGPDPAHPSALQVRSYDPKAWEKYFKFTVVRNPWDHAVSYYYWKLRERNNPPVTFKEFLKRADDPSRPDPENIRPTRQSNFDVYSINGEVAVDYIAKFEDLENELSFLSEKIGIPIDSSIRAKENSRDKKTTLADHYDAECMDLVCRIYKPEIDYFGYEPPFSLPSQD